MVQIMSACEFFTDGRTVEKKDVCLKIHNIYAKIHLPLTLGKSVI